VFRAVGPLFEDVVDQEGDVAEEEADVVREE
jgi:hypothetical protein